MTATFHAVREPLCAVNLKFVTKYSGNTDLSNPSKCRSVAKKYLSICVAHLRRKTPLPAELRFFFEQATPEFKSAVDRMLRPYFIEFDDISNGRLDIVHRLIH